MAARTLTPEQLLGEVEDLLRTMPGEAVFIEQKDEGIEWCGRANAVMERMGAAKQVAFESALRGLHGNHHQLQESLQVMKRVLQQSRHSLRRSIRWGR